MADSGSTITPDHLRVAYAESPLDVGTTTPEFSWRFTPEHATATQTAYRIQVTEPADELFDAPIWDSGWIRSDRSVGVSPEDGTTFDPGRDYRWRVGTEIDDEKTWSEPDTFALAPANWEAEWITAPPIESRRDYDREPDPAPYLRTEFDLPTGEIDRARAYVVGLGFNEFFCNGSKVGNAVLDPALTHYNKRVLYSVHDLTDRLQTGESNAIGAILGRGRYALTTPSAWDWHDAPWQSDRPALRAAVHVDYTDGREEIIRTDEHWRAVDSPIRFDSLYEGEIHDARVDRGNWTAPNFDDSNWQGVNRHDGPDGSFVVQELQPIEVVKEVTPESVESVETEDGETVYVYDIGEMMAGWVELSVQAASGTQITVHQAERRGDDRRPDLTQGHVDAKLQKDIFITSAAETDTFEPRFGYKGFRYVELRGLDEPPALEQLTAKSIHSVVERGWRSDFACENGLLTKLQDNTRRAMLNNYFGIPTGCTVFEKNGWSGDTQLSCEASLYNFDMIRFYRKWLQDFADAQRDDGELPPIVPTTGWGYRDEGGMSGPKPGWDGAYILIPWWLYQYRGDERTLEAHYSGMKQYVDYLGGFAEGHILDVGIGDWVPPGSGRTADTMRPPEGPSITATAYYYRFARILTEVADVFDASDDRRRYTALAEEIQDAFHDRFWDRSREYYRTGEVEEYRQTSNVVPLSFGLVPDEHKQTVIDGLVDDVIETHDGHLNTGILGTKELLTTLTENGHVDVAYTIATQRDYPSWGHWIEQGATALWELWEDHSRSLDHHMFGSIVDWFFGYLAGIRPAAPGFKRARIDPAIPTALDGASATVDTHYGTIEASWTQSDNGLSMTTTIPTNTEAVIHVPVEDPAAVQTSSQSQSLPAPTRQESGQVIYEVGPGEWEFSVQ